MSVLILFINQGNTTRNSKASLGHGLATQEEMEMRSEETMLAQDFADSCKAEEENRCSPVLCFY